MDFIKFESKHVLGIEEIDNQHKKIYETVNKLFEMQNSTKVEIIDIYQNLLKEFKIHFETEESLMKKNKVVEFISHKLEHDRALQKYSDYLKTLKKANSKLDMEILKSMKNWLENHFEKKDIKLKQFLNLN
ncbi:MAG: hemerythrin family protein [Ignavibacteriales bacterium]|nr:hemerythrin family protein [Ignavibacteriales bacterium]MBK7981625.1 hemerythrin family protein [Ignavibacteriota bacterium]